MQVVYDKEQKGPVSALSHINGFLLTAVGQKVRHCSSVTGCVLWLVIYRCVCMVNQYLMVAMTTDLVSNTGASAVSCTLDS